MKENLIWQDHRKQGNNNRGQRLGMGPGRQDLQVIIMSLDLILGK